MKKLSRVSLKRLVFAFSMVGLLLLPAGMVFAETRVYLCDGEPCPSQDVNSVTKLMTFGLSRAGMFAFGMSFVSGQIAGAMKGPFGINLGSSVGDPLKKMNKTGTDRVKKTGIWRRQEEIAKDIKRGRETNQASLISTAISGTVGVAQTLRSVGRGGKETRLAQLSVGVAEAEAREKIIADTRKAVDDSVAKKTAERKKAREKKIAELAATPEAQAKDTDSDAYNSWLALRQANGEKLNEAETESLKKYTEDPKRESDIAKLEAEFTFSPADAALNDALKEIDEKIRHEKIQAALGLDLDNETDQAILARMDAVASVVQESSWGLTDVSSDAFDRAAEKAEEERQRAEKQHRSFVAPLGAESGKVAGKLDAAVATVLRQTATKKMAVDSAGGIASAAAGNSSPQLTQALVQLFSDPQKRSLMKNQFFRQEIIESVARSAAGSKNSNAFTNLLNADNRAAYAHEVSRRSSRLGSAVPESEIKTFLDDLASEDLLALDPEKDAHKDGARRIGSSSYSAGMMFQRLRSLDNLSQALKFNKIEELKDAFGSSGRISLDAKTTAAGTYARDEEGYILDVSLPAQSNLKGRFRGGNYDVSVFLDMLPLQSLLAAALNPENDERNVIDLANGFALNGFLDDIKTKDANGNEVVMDKKEARAHLMELMHTMWAEKNSKKRQKHGENIMDFLLQGQNFQDQTLDYDEAMEGMGSNEAGDVSPHDELVASGEVGPDGKKRAKVRKKAALWLNKSKDSDPDQRRGSAERAANFGEFMKMLQDSRKPGVSTVGIEEFRKKSQADAVAAGYAEGDVAEYEKQLKAIKGAAAVSPVTPQPPAQATPAASSLDRAREILAQNNVDTDQREDEDDATYAQRLIGEARQYSASPATAAQSGGGGINPEQIDNLDLNLSNAFRTGTDKIVEAIEKLPDQLQLSQIGAALVPKLAELQQGLLTAQGQAGTGAAGSTAAQTTQKQILQTLRNIGDDLPVGMARFTSQQLNQAGLSPQLSTIGQAFFSPQLEDKDRMDALQGPNGISLLMAALKSGNPQLQQQAGAFAGRMLQGPDTQAQAINILSDVMQTSPVEGRALLGQITTSTSKDQLLGISTPILSSDDHTLRNEFARGVVISALPADTKSSLIEAFQSHPDSFLLTQETSAALMQQLPQVQDPYLKQQILGLVASRGDNASANSTVELLKTNANEYSTAFGAVSADQYGAFLNRLNGPTGQNASALSLDIPPQAWETFARMTNSGNSALTAQKQEVFVEFLGQQLTPLQPASREAFLRESLAAVPGADVGNSELHKILSSKINGQGRLLEHIDELLQQLVP